MDICCAVEFLCRGGYRKYKTHGATLGHNYHRNQLDLTKGSPGQYLELRIVKGALKNIQFFVTSGFYFQLST